MSYDGDDPLALKAELDILLAESFRKQAIIDERHAQRARKRAALAFHTARVAAYQAINARQQAESRALQSRVKALQSRVSRLTERHATDKAALTAHLEAERQRAAAEPDTYLYRPPVSNPTD